MNNHPGAPSSSTKEKKKEEEEDDRPANAVDVRAVALDLDGTIRPSGGTVGVSLLTQLASLRRTGVNVILVTGRALADLDPLVDKRAFDAVVLENGAILWIGGKETFLSPPEWNQVRENLLRLFPTPGHERVILALRREMEDSVLALMADSRLGDDLAKIEFNKDALMILPAGVDKGTGLLAALRALGVPPRQTMCIGDGENDIAMLRIAGVAVALKNAVPELKAVASYVASQDDGAGVSEAISKFCGAV